VKIIVYLAIAFLAHYYIALLYRKTIKHFAWKYWYKNFYLQSPHWQTTRWLKRTQVLLEKGSVQCEDCGNKKNLQVHHETYERLGAERLADLKLLCDGCHKKRHKIK
jgi:5-methylcytosine-specific restriction endonuclease McrA